MPKIIALIDGSIYSESICDHAAWIAAATDSSVQIVHVLGRRSVPSEESNFSGSIGLGARTALLEELAELDGQKAKLAHKRGRAILEDAKVRISKSGVNEISTKLRNGEIVETVQELEETADLIVIGKRGEGADFDKLHLGSNLERVVRSSHKPVLVASRAFKPIQRFLIAFDGGASAIKAVEHVARNHMFSDIQCQLLTVGTETTEGKRQLEGAAATLRNAGFTVETEILPGQAEEVIAKKAESGDIDLLVMGAYGHSRIRNLIIGSTTTEMLRSCKIPVMLFR